ncbi:MAG: bluetail domain-containing putative surface protein, partial [Cyanobacteriota bacterium]
QCTEHQASDRIDLGRFDERIIGAPSSRRRITSLTGTASDLSVTAIRKTLGAGFTGFRAAAFNVTGISGSFLAVNNSLGSFDNNDFLIHLPNYTPSDIKPITLS